MKRPVGEAYRILFSVKFHRHRITMVSHIFLQKITLSKMRYSFAEKLHYYFDIHKNNKSQKNEKRE